MDDNNLARNPATQCRPAASPQAVRKWHLSTARRQSLSSEGSGCPFTGQYIVARTCRIPEMMGRCTCPCSGEPFRPSRCPQPPVSVRDLQRWSAVHADRDFMRPHHHYAGTAAWRAAAAAPPLAPRSWPQFSISSTYSSGWDCSRCPMVRYARFWAVSRASYSFQVCTTQRVAGQPLRRCCPAPEVPPAQRHAPPPLPLPCSVHEGRVGGAGRPARAGASVCHQWAGATRLLP